MTRHPLTYRDPEFWVVVGFAAAWFGLVLLLVAGCSDASLTAEQLQQAKAKVEEWAKAQRVPLCITDLTTGKSYEGLGNINGVGTTYLDVGDETYRFSGNISWHQGTCESKP